MPKYHGQSGFRGFHPTREFISCDKGTPLVMFAGASNYAVESNGHQVSFTIGEDVTINPEGSEESVSLAGKRGIIRTLDLKVLLDNAIPAVLQGTLGKPHPFHQITPEEALQMKDEFDVALGMAEIARINDAEQKADQDPNRQP